MLSSFGIRAYSIFIESFLALAFNNSILRIHHRTGAATLFGQALVFALACVGCTMCVAAALANAIGIEAESTKCAGRSKAGLVANSPGRRHCQPLMSKFDLFFFNFRICIAVTCATLN